MSLSEDAAPAVSRGRHRHAAPEDEEHDEAAGAAADENAAVQTAAVEDEDDRPTGRHSFAALQELLRSQDDERTAVEARSTEPQPTDPETAPDPAEVTAILPAITIEPTPDQSAEAAPAEGPSTAPAAPSRAGRNLSAAVGIGLLLGGVILASLFGYRPSFVGLISLAVAYGIYELITALHTVGARPPLVPLLVGGVAMDVAAWYRGPNGLVVVTFITICAAMIWRLGDGADGYLRDISGAVLITLYLPLLAGFAVLLTHPSDGAARVILFIATVVCSDTGGYFAGVLFGRHPLAPTVSRAKTWEGFSGSVIACAVCGSLIVSLTFHQPWWQGALFGLAIAVTATVGDLGESLIKRDLGLKDMGRLLPGHGGLMDRLDSLLPGAAVAYLVLSAILSG